MMRGDRGLLGEFGGGVSGDTRPVYKPQNTTPARLEASLVDR